MIARKDGTVRIQFTYDPNDPKSYEKEKSKAIYRHSFGAFALIGTVASSIMLAEMIVDLFYGHYNKDLLMIMGMLILSGIVFLIVIPENKLERRVLAPKLTVLFFGSSFILCGVCAFLYLIGKPSDGISNAVLAIPVIWVVVIALSMYFLVKRINANEDDRTYYILQKMELRRLEKKKKEEKERETIRLEAQETISRFEEKNQFKTIKSEESPIPQKEETVRGEIHLEVKAEPRIDEQNQFKEKINEEPTVQQEDNSAEAEHVKEQETPEWIYCRKCGKKLPGDSVFCSTCGIKLLV